MNESDNSENTKINVFQTVERIKSSNIQNNKSNALLSGVVLSITTILLILLVNYLPQKGAKSVASLVAGMFGSTAIQALRKSYDG